MRRKIVKAYNMIYIFLPLPLTVPPTLPYLLATHLPPPLPPSKLIPILHPFCNFCLHSLDRTTKPYFLVGERFR